MTKIIYDRNAMSIYVKGHAGTAPKGKDIVYAGVSALTEAMVRRVKCRGIWNPSLQINPERAEVFLKLRPTDGYEQILAEELLETVCGGYQAIAEEYPDYVKVEVR